MRPNYLPSSSAFPRTSATFNWLHFPWTLSPYKRPKNKGNKLLKKKHIEWPTSEQMQLSFNHLLPPCGLIVCLAFTPLPLGKATQDPPSGKCRLFMLFLWLGLLKRLSESVGNICRNILIELSPRFYCCSPTLSLGIVIVRVSQWLL